MQYVALAIEGITLGAIYALVALGFNLIYRTVGILDFAQGDKVVAGGLLALALVDLGLPLALVFVLIIGAGAVAGTIYDFLVVRFPLRRGVDAAVVATVGALLVLSSGHILVWGDRATFPSDCRGNRRDRLVAGGFTGLRDLGVVAVIVAALAVFLTRNRYGKAMVASAADPMAAGALGINVSRMRVLASSLAFALAAVAGVLIAPITLAGGTVGPSLTLKAFTAATLGGLSSTTGVVVGALILGLFETIVGSKVPSEYRDPLVFGILIVVLLIRPNGLFGVRERTV